MNKIHRRWLSFLLVLAILLTSVPIAPSSARADTTTGTSALRSPTFFYPSDRKLSETANAELDTMTSVAYRVSSGSMTISGTFRSVTADSIHVLIENMVSKGTGNNNWTTDKQSSKGVTVSGTSFEASNLQLYTGYNRITISGTSNGDSKTDVFYVYYDAAPYLKSLQVVVPGSADPINLNEGTVRVIQKPGNEENYRMFVYLQGTAANVQEIRINNMVAQATDDGSFFTPQLELTPGENKINFTIHSNSDSVSITRTIYYYDQEKPFIDIQMTHAGSEGPFSLMNGNEPSFTGGTIGQASQATLAFTMLIPYSKASSVNTFLSGSVISAKVGDGVVQELTPDAAGRSETVIYNSEGKPDFLVIKFSTNGLSIPATASGRQPLFVGVVYNTDVIDGRASDLAFNIFRENVVVNNIELMEKAANGTFSSLGALNGKELSNSSFFIKVTADKNIFSGATPTEVMKAQLIPLGLSNLVVTYQAKGANDSEGIYEVTGLPTGTQQLQFWFGNSLSKYPVSLHFVSKTYIEVEGLYDQQILEVRSGGAEPNKGVTVKFVGFSSAPQVPSYTLNGVSKNLNVQDGKASISIPISQSDEGLIFGENILTIRAENVVGNAVQTVEKVIRVYMIDTNEPKFLNLRPLEIPSSGSGRPAIRDAMTVGLKQIQYDKAGDKYTTKLKKYDVGLIGSGATRVTVLKNGESFVTFDLSATGISLNGTTTVKYSVDGSSSSFAIRLEDLTGSTTNSDIYSFELRNSTGAKVIKKLELSRQVADIVIWSPVPTVGDRVVVNKNFVLFDIEAEGADSVLVDGKAASPRTDIADRYTYTYIGLKAQKDQNIKITINRKGGAKNETITVYYTGTVQPGSQFMQKLGNKHTMFDGNLLLEFPKNTVLKTARPSQGIQEATKYYDRNNLLFGIAAPNDGVVERVNDYGEMIGTSDSRLPEIVKGPFIPLDNRMKGLYTNTTTTRQFISISPVYWISGGLGESRRSGTLEPATDGFQPYTARNGFAQNNNYNYRKIIPTERGTLTLKFDDNLVAQAGAVVTVFQMTDSGEWKNIGGIVDTKKNTIKVNFDDFGYFKVMKLRESFPDVTRHGWARDTLDALFAKGVMNNVAYDQFGTDNQISRGEFAALLIRALGSPLTGDGTNTFVDVQNPMSIDNPGYFDNYGPGRLWKYAEIETAARAGIITGKEQRLFDVNGRITRQDAAVMVARAMELKLQANDAPDSTNKKLLSSLEKLFTDGTNISYYARPSVMAVNSAGILLGRANPLQEGQKKETSSFAPQANLTRAEAGMMMLRIMKQKTKTFPAEFG